MSELAQKLIAENLKTKNPVLDLGNCGLDGTEDGLYRPLAEAGHLEALIFSNKQREASRNSLIQIPAYLPKKLKSLVLAGELNNRWNIQNISALKDLPQLGTLSLSHNQIQDNSALKNLQQLRILSLNRNKIKNISFLKDLHQLQDLALNANLIQEISSLKDLHRLQSLDLSGNFIQDISPLKDLHQLRMLDLNGNFVQDLSPLKELHQLKSLYARGNHIQDISCLKDLKQLQVLALSGDKYFYTEIQISSLANYSWNPFTLLNRKKLIQSSNLRGNQIQDISSLKGLQKLRRLDVSGNQIREFPLDFLNACPKLEELNLRNNPIQNIPKEIFDKEENALTDVRHYVEDLSKGAIQNNEVKVILIGNGSVGKTQIARQLTGLEFDPDYRSTHAISLMQHTVDCDLIPEGLQLNIWDFGGQDIYHATHRMFMQTRALFLLVWDLENENKEYHEWEGRKYKNEKLLYWLEYATLFGKNSPTLILQNKIDIPDQKEIPKPEQKQYQQAYPIFKFLRVSAKTGQGFSVLADTLERIFEEEPALRQELLERKLPVSWVQVRDKVRDEQAKSDGLKQFSADVFQEWCTAANVEDSAETILQFFHNTGVLYYQKEYFSGKILLDQAWAIKAIYKLFDREGSYFEIIEGNEGKLTYRDFSKIWPDNTDQERSLFIDFMLSAELCFETTMHRIYVVPQLLREDKPNYISDYVRAHGIEQLHEIPYRFLPSVFIHRFIVKAKDFANVEDMWQTGIYLQYGEQYAVVEANYRESKIIIWYNAGADELVSAIQDELEAINQNTSIKAIQGEIGFMGKYLRKSFEQLRAEDKPALSVNQKNMVSTKSIRDKIFVSYSHKDKETLKRVQVHLKVLENEGIAVNLWDDTQIKGGMKWREEIENALASAKVAILLVSTEFLASDFITKIELPSLLKAAETEGATILPLILKPCRFTRHKALSEFQAVNEPSKPLSSLSEHAQDEILVKLTDRIEELMLV